MESRIGRMDNSDVNFDFNRLIKNLASLYPTSVAVTDFHDGKLSKFTYPELADVVGRLKSAIVEQTRPHEGVAILLPVGAASICAFWAAVCAERCYIPLFVEMATERLEAILTETGPALVIAEPTSSGQMRSLLESLGYKEVGSRETLGSVVCFHNENGRDLGAAGKPAAIVYTSGSTGRPKGIMHSRRSLNGAIAAFRDTFRMEPGDRVFTTVPHHFDVAIFDIFSFLITGAELVIPPPEIFERPRALSEFLSLQDVACFHAVPTTSRLVLNYGKPERFQYPRMKQVITGGEILTVDTVRRFREVFPTATVHNVYGPAEIICCTHFAVPDDFFLVSRESVPIGRIFGDNEYRIAADGELLVTGSQLMIGYWNNPELTNEKISLIDGKRWYATGDIVRLAENGWLEYRGRRDRMVKRRGIRVELDDIQSNLTKIPGIAAAAVVSRPDAIQGCRIVAHVCLEENHERDPWSLKDACQSVLPLDLVPDRFEVHNGLPRTSTGKIDYQALVALG